MFKDYYAILEITIDTDAIGIKKAYRMMCIKWHPDRNPDVDTTQQMIDINEAYAVLSNPDKKVLYDIEYRKFKQKYSNRKSNCHESYEQKVNTHDYTVEDENLTDIINEANEYARNYVNQLLAEIKSNLKDAANGAIENMKSLFVAYIILLIIVTFILAFLS